MAPQYHSSEGKANQKQGDTKMNAPVDQTTKDKTMITGLDALAIALTDDKWRDSDKMLGRLVGTRTYEDSPEAGNGVYLFQVTRISLEQRSGEAAYTVWTSTPRVDFLGHNEGGSGWGAVTVATFEQAEEIAAALMGADWK